MKHLRDKIADEVEAKFRQRVEDILDGLRYERVDDLFEDVLNEIRGVRL